MLALKVPLKDAEKWKQYLLFNDLMDKEYHYGKDDDNIYLPVMHEFTLLISSGNSSGKSSGVEFVQWDFKKTIRKGTLKENLSKELTKEEFEFVKAAHDNIGTIAIVEIPQTLEHREKIIAQTLLKTNPQIKTVLKKANIHEGVYRTQKMTYLAGVDTKETIYRENNVLLKLDVEKVYFSVRLGNERKRIMQLVYPGEEILVMFSGAAPYPIVLSKNTKAKHILGIEINPEGHKYGLENIRLNKVQNVDLICGDVHKIIPELIAKDPNKKLSFDRILMPLPKTADEFLDDALAVSRNGTIIHFYDFLEIGKFDDALLKIDKACEKREMKHEVLEIVKCGQHAPYIYRICVDFKIL